MKAVVFERYGPPEALSLREVDKPAGRPNEILVKICSAGVNPQDWHCVRGTPLLGRLLAGGLLRPGHPIPGSDIAGTVEVVGKDVTRFKPGDDVFAMSFKHGAFAEYVTLPETGVVAVKPSALSFEEAAAVPMAGTMALMGVRDQCRVKENDRVLINGASGGIGTFAVQIAKALDAHVTGVCSTRNLGLVESLGADRVIDYTQEDFTHEAEHYDAIFDVVAKRTFAECRRALAPNGIYVTTHFSPSLLLWSFLVTVTSAQRLKPMLQPPRQTDLLALRELINAGKLRSVIDRRFHLAEVPEAIAYVEQGHARGKVVIDVRA